MNLVIDLDGTLTVDCKNKSYEEKPVNWALVKRLREYKKLGFRITIFTARNMNSYDGDVELITKNTLPIILEWLGKHKIPYDDVIVGKPWCGTEGFYVDDRAIRPSEFTSLSPKEVREVLKREHQASGA